MTLISPHIPCGATLSLRIHKRLYVHGHYMLIKLSELILG
jgi:hypothetical protein